MFQSLSAKVKKKEKINATKGKENKHISFDGEKRKKMNKATTQRHCVFCFLYKNCILFVPFLRTKPLNTKNKEKESFDKRSTDSTFEYPLSPSHFSQFLSLAHDLSMAPRFVGHALVALALLVLAAAAASPGSAGVSCAGDAQKPYLCPDGTCARRCRTARA